MTARRPKIGWTILFLLPFAYHIGSEVYYSRSIVPHGIVGVRDYFDRFGEPMRIQQVRREGRTYYEFTGRRPEDWVLAAPSAPPAYVFDEQGRLVDWCSDPGDVPNHRTIWPLASTVEVEIGAIRERFAIR